MAPQDFLPEAHRQTSADHVELDLPDVVLVNPGGRVVEVTGEMAEKLLLENGYRRATETEAKQVEDYKKRTHPELLRRKEIQRVRSDRALVDQLERELAGEDPTIPDPVEGEEQGSDEGEQGNPKPRSRK